MAASTITMDAIDYSEFFTRYEVNNSNKNIKVVRFL